MSRKVGIVGHEAAKFTAAAQAEARAIIRRLLDGAALMVSGGCHLGGVDIWAEEEADALGMEKLIHMPHTLSWDGGYKVRNQQIAESSDEVHVIVVAKLPPSYSGMRFSSCYHCQTAAHVKSGGCWTAKRAQHLGKPAFWHVVGGSVGSGDQT